MTTTKLIYNQPKRTAQFECLCEHSMLLGISMTSFQCENCKTPYKITGSGEVRVKPYKFRPVFKK